MLALATVGPARAQSLGPVFEPAPGVTRGPAAGEQGRVDVALFDGGALAAWEDHRRSARFADVFIARLDPAGAVLDPTGIPLGTFYYDDWAPRIACGSTVCLVAWSTDADVRVARVAFDGRVVDQAPLSVASFTGDAIPAGVTFDGAVFRVVWVEYQDFVWTTVSEAGQVGPTSRAPGSSQINAFASVWAAGAHRVAWSNPNSGFTTALFDDGGASAPVSFGPSGITRLALAHDGTSGFVAWQAAAASTDLVAAPLDAQLVTGGAPALLHDRAAVVRGYVRPTPFVVFAREESGAPEVWFAERDGGGFDVRPGSSSDDGRTAPALAGTLADGHLAFVRQQLDPDVFVSRWSAGAIVPSTERLLTSSGEPETAARLAAAPGRALLVYQRLTEGGRAEAVALGANGAPLGAPHVFAGPDAGAVFPDVAFDGTRFVTAWVSGDLVLGRALGLDGAPLGPTFQLDDSSYGRASVAAAGDARLACYGRSSGLTVRTFDAAGATGARLAIPGARGACAVGAGPGGFMVAYALGVTPAFRLLAADGTPRGGEVSLPSVPGLSVEHRDLAVGSSPSGYLLVWRPEVESKLFAVRVDADGGLLDPGPLTLFTRAALGVQDQLEGRYPTVAFDGTDWVVAWDNTLPDAGADVFYRRVGTDGTLRPLSRLADGPVDQEDVALASASDGRVWAAWSEWEPLPGADALRLRTRLESTLDAGAGSDAGTPADAGTSDAGVVPPAALRVLDVRCGCDAGGAPLLLLALAALARKRDRTVAR